MGTFSFRLLAAILAVQASVAWALPTGVLCVSLDAPASHGEAECCDDEDAPQVHATALAPLPAPTDADCCETCLDIALDGTSPGVAPEDEGTALPSEESAPWPKVDDATLHGSADATRRTALALQPSALSLRSLRTIVLTC